MTNSRLAAKQAKTQNALSVCQTVRQAKQQYFHPILIPSGLNCRDQPGCVCQDLDSNLTIMNRRVNLSLDIYRDVQAFFVLLKLRILKSSTATCGETLITVLIKWIHCGRGDTGNLRKRVGCLSACKVVVSCAKLLGKIGLHYLIPR